MVVYDRMQLCSVLHQLFWSIEGCLVYPLCLLIGKRYSACRTDVRRSRMGRVSKFQAAEARRPRMNCFHTLRAKIYSAERITMNTTAI